MSRNVSPLFAVIVVVFAVVIGFLSFMWRLRSYDAAEKAEAQVLQAQADAQRLNAMRSGSYGRMGSRMRAARRGGGGPGQKPGAAPGGPSKPAGATAEKPKGPAPAKPETTAPKAESSAQKPAAKTGK